MIIKQLVFYKQIQAVFSFKESFLYILKEQFVSMLFIYLKNDHIHVFFRIFVLVLNLDCK